MPIPPPRTTTQPTSAERRITLRLLAYWEKLRQGGVMPAAEAVNPEDIKDLWDDCFLVRRAYGSYMYVHLGEAIADTCRMDSQHGGKLATRYGEVFAYARPIMEEGKFIQADHSLIKFRQCLLPLGSGERVEAIFGTLRYKHFPA